MSQLHRCAIVCAFQFRNNSKKYIILTQEMSWNKIWFFFTFIIIIYWFRFLWSYLFDRMFNYWPNGFSITLQFKTHFICPFNECRVKFFKLWKSNYQLLCCVFECECFTILHTNHFSCKNINRWFFVVLFFFFIWGGNFNFVFDSFNL